MRWLIKGMVHHHPIPPIIKRCLSSFSEKENKTQIKIRPEGTCANDCSFSSIDLRGLLKSILSSVFTDCMTFFLHWNKVAIQLILPLICSCKHLNLLQHNWF